MKVTFSFYKVSPQLPKQAKLKKFIAELFRLENKVAEIVSFIFCEDEYLLSINQEFLNHDTLTDIVTFNLRTKNFAIIGEIYISIDRIIENAHDFGAEFIEELHRVIFHGVLHLCGYKDKTIVQKNIMRQKEEQYLKLYFS